MNKIEVVRTVFQSALSGFIFERDDAISKINRALNCNDPNINIELIIKDNLEKLAKSNLNIRTTEEELQNLCLEVLNSKKDDGNNS